MIAICQLILWELLIPIVVGMLFVNVDKSGKSLPFMWVSGQFLLWAVFQGISVPMILAGREFIPLVWLYAVLVGILLVTAIATKGRTYVGGVCESIRNTFLDRKKASDRKKKLLPCAYWLCFWAILAFQLMKAVLMTYGDGDDAYYVAVTTITNDAETMYQKLPYTGGSTQLDARHGLAPLPIWIAFLAEVSGVPSVTAAHVAVPLMFIPMTYACFYLVGRKLFVGSRDKLPLFLIFTELLVVFGDYSIYTVENFMIARSRQGKAAFGSIVIPMLFFLLFVLLEHWQEQKSLPRRYWILLVCVMMTGCLCSTMGAMLTCMLLGITAIVGVISYKKWKYLIPLGLVCAPCVLYAFVYLILE